MKNNFSRRNKIYPSDSSKFHQKSFFIPLCFAISTSLFGLAYGIIIWYFTIGPGQPRPCFSMNLCGTSFTNVGGDDQVEQHCLTGFSYAQTTFAEYGNQTFFTCNYRQTTV
ncbi:Oidioi.mRNA.OKI2018_I69.chr1.g171.t1.cds [Oikopleura dioica]|uniref:Oidioi.mRNA.OKI2018_I69.chr1.g171.t1.cds n=1 Tax=Oikopleura dioica TaxID=34765 RepID=A0ABN7SJ14_OIKDI|nr:Oidioi.mRNA.OKI2018_I69.chr1.g171.t1.cds [Oikopleura dioica]